jgi:hypothetical protein
MNDLIAIQKIAGWEKLKTLVLDSVSSPITAGSSARLHQGHRQRMARIAGGSRPRFVVDHYKDVGNPETRSRGGR